MKGCCTTTGSSFSKTLNADFRQKTCNTILYFTWGNHYSRMKRDTTLQHLLARTYYFRDFVAANCYSCHTVSHGWKIIGWVGRKRLCEGRYVQPRELYLKVPCIRKQCGVLYQLFQLYCSGLLGSIKKYAYQLSGFLS